jgi:hypothetical protein
VLPLKIVRPRWFDGTALCVGSMAPDFSYPLGGWMLRQNHTAIGVVLLALPASLVICWAIRTWVASCAFAHLPDLGWMRVHSYRVLATRRPAWWLTVSSALIGATTHVILDAFTHWDRWGARWVGWDDRRVDVPVTGLVRLPDLLQNLGHTIGTAICIALLVYIGYRRLLERWYGTDAVEQARGFTLTADQRVWFWSVAAIGVPVGIVWVLIAPGYAMHKLIDAVALSTAIACALPRAQPG